MNAGQQTAQEVSAKADQTSGLPYAIFRARSDRWGQLARCAELWARGKKDDDRESVAGDCAALLMELEVVEHYFAYPGAPIMAALREQVDAADAIAVGRLARRVASTISAGTYRRDARAWDLDAEGKLEARDYLPPPMAGERSSTAVSCRSAHPGSGGPPRPGRRA